MILSKLPNCSWGVEINKLQLRNASHREILKIGELIMEHQVVLLREQDLTAKEEIQVCLAIGEVEKVTAYNRCPIAEDGQVLNEIQRVTGLMHPDGTPMGLFGHDHDLDWHANRPSAEMERKPIIWLRSIFGSEGSRTSWANCTLAYNDLNDEFKNELDELYGIFGFEPNKYTSWNEWKSHRNYEGIKIVRNIPGLKGKVLFFPFLQVFGFKDREDEYFQNVYKKLKQHILQDKYVYHHHWCDGDVLLSEQWGTIHKRWQCDVSRRMLHRISFGWEKVLVNSNEKSLSN